MENNDQIVENAENTAPANEQGAENLNSETATENTVENTTAENAVNKPSTEQELQAKVNELNDKYLRMYAEYDNYKRRSIKEKQDYMATAGKEIFVSLLGVLDDFDRAMKAIETAKDIEAVKEGIVLIHNKIKTTLQHKGLEPMLTINTEFDSDVHEAITSIPAANEEQKNKVIDEVEKGYYLNGKVIRVAKVVIGA